MATARVLRAETAERRAELLGLLDVGRRRRRFEREIMRQKAEEGHG